MKNFKLWSLHRLKIDHILNWILVNTSCQNSSILSRNALNDVKSVFIWNQKYQQQNRIQKYYWDPIFKCTNSKYVLLHCVSDSMKNKIKHFFLKISVTSKWMNESVKWCEFLSKKNYAHWWFNSLYVLILCIVLYCYSPMACCCCFCCVIH